MPRRSRLRIGRCSACGTSHPRRVSACPMYRPALRTSRPRRAPIRLRNVSLVTPLLDDPVFASGYITLTNCQRFDHKATPLFLGDSNDDRTGCQVGLLD
ncbi:zinc ribbon domain-containing protein [Marivita sp.]|uniref:zinc ribbon domain-containing protein n=1 Tax=Marivita sp. TaxID=2003365 RepID=UPI0034590856